MKGEHIEHYKIKYSEKSLDIDAISQLSKKEQKRYESLMVKKRDQGLTAKEQKEYVKLIKK